KKLMTSLAKWCLRYPLLVAVDPSVGLSLDITGCAHLWGGEEPYLNHIVNTFQGKGYDLRAAIADTMGAAWAVARYGRHSMVILPDAQRQALLPLPPASLRLEQETLVRMERLGFWQVGQFIDLPPSLLRKRFGDILLLRLGQALGTEREPMEPVKPRQP